MGDANGDASGASCASDARIITLRVSSNPFRCQVVGSRVKSLVQGPRRRLHENLDDFLPTCCRKSLDRGC